MGNQEWAHRVNQLQVMAKRVMAQGGSPLDPAERTALYGRLTSRPVYLLGSTSWLARNFMRFARQRLDVRAVVDDVSREPAIEGIPRTDGREFVAAGAGSVAICLAFSHAAKQYFEQLARSAGAELAHYLEAVDAIPDCPREPILGSLARTTAENIETLIEAAEHWADPFSRHTFLSLLSGRLTYDRTWAESVDVGPQTMYFGVDCIRLGTDEVLVDCGAFDGDTISDFRARTRDRFAAIVGLEPDPQNFALLKQRQGGDPRIRLHPLAAAAEAGVLSFGAGLGPVSFSPTEGPAAENIAVPARSLDSLLECRPTLVKIDVEGGEPEVLEGARRTIAKARPRLLIAAYHRPLHMAEFPQWIESVAPGYRFHLRHHGAFFLETVLYAIPEM